MNNVGGSSGDMAALVAVNLGTDTTVNIATEPTAPRSVVGIAGDTQASVSWDAPTSDGGSDITDKGGVVRDGGGLVSLRIFELKKPVIAAINGAAVGVGATMTLPMDIRLASTKAKFGFVFAKRGIVPEACSSWFLPRLVGISQAAEWVYTGRLFSAEEALSGGLVRSIHEPEYGHSGH